MGYGSKIVGAPLKAPLKNAFAGLCLLGLSACGQVAAPSDKADMVFIGGQIHAMDEGRGVFKALAVKDGKILYVGDEEGVKAFQGPQTLVQKLEAGEAIFPGFTDSHVHLASGGEALLGLDLAGAKNLESLLEKIRTYATEHPELPVIFGSGWQLGLFEAANPQKDLLDQIVPDRPVILEAADGHNHWVNSAALKAAGLDENSPDPVNGRIERSLDGTPSGTLREAASSLVTKLIPEPTLAQLEARIRKGVQYQLSHGYTASIDAAVTAGSLDAAFANLQNSGDVAQHIRLSLLAEDAWATAMATPETSAQIVQDLSKRRAVFRAAQGCCIDAEAVKIFVDGVVENHTAALSLAYRLGAHNPTHQGQLNLAPEALDTYVAALLGEGFQLHFHAIGDRAVAGALDAIEKASPSQQERAKQSGHAPHISHLELVQPADIMRFANLGVTANLQMLWHFPDDYITGLTLPFIDPQLHDLLYPAQSFAGQGVPLVYGSDWSVSTSDPFLAGEVAVRRADPDLSESPDNLRLVPSEALTVDQVMLALTRGGASLMGQLDQRGTLEVGKRADFTITSADPYQAMPDAISDIVVKATYFGGKKAFSAD